MSRGVVQLGLSLVLVVGASELRSAPQRLKPPAGITCPRDHLTVYSGRVLHYRRTPGRIVLRIYTDSDTSERVELKAPERTSLEDHLRLSGQPFVKEDWEKIESRPRRLRPNMRASAWVCDDGRPPVIDWHPDEPVDASQKPR
ncbi:MAG: hypothetical protein ACRD2Q_08625 [Terriglobales bacterium]